MLIKCHSQDYSDQWLWHLVYAKIKHIYSNNWIFTFWCFLRGLCWKYFTLSFSGCAAYHQNACAEHAIQVIMNLARTFLLHTSMHWCHYGVDEIVLWSFTIKNATWLFNQLPNYITGSTWKCSSRHVLITVMSSELISGVFLLLYMIPSFKIVRKSPIGITVLIWVN